MEILFSILHVVTALFLIGPMAILPITTPWILISILVYGIALLLNLFVVVPTMRRAAEEPPAASGGMPSGGRKPMGYGRIAATPGMSAVLLTVVVVLMVWKP